MSNACDIKDMDARLKWPAFGVADPQRPGTIEGGQFVINKRQTWKPLNLAWFYNDHSDYYYRYGFGDKHTFEVAWTRCAQPFVMWQPKAQWVNVAYVHVGPDLRPLFVHRCQDKFRFDNHGYSTMQVQRLPSYCSALPLEKECWKWLSELARLMGRTRVFARMLELNELPACRWRKSRSDGALFCFSEKFVAPPNAIAPETCRKCPYQDHDPIMAECRPNEPIHLHWEPTPAYRVYEPKSRASRKSTIAIGTLYTPEIAELGNLTSKVLREYAERHGYTAVIATSRIDISRHPVWSKVVLVERYLTENPACEWMMWIDADAVVTNPEKRLEELCDKTIDFLVAQDLPPSPINAGVFFMRNCPATIDLLRRTYAKTQYLNAAWREQTALYEAWCESAETVRSRIVPRRLFNAFAFEHQKGDFIKHFPGWSTEAKVAGVKSAIACGTEAFRDLLPVSPGATGRRTPSTRPAKRSTLPPMFCITCPQTPERTAAAAQHFRERRLDVKFFPGIHGNTFGLRAALPSRRRMQGGHVGALLSHYMLWQTLAFLPHEEILILEDDAWFEPTFRQRFRRAYADLPKDWQFAFVGAVLMEGRPSQRITNRVGVTCYPCGTHAYMVKRSVLPYLLQTNHEARIPLDLQPMANTLPAVKCYTFTPSLVKQRSATSPADGTGENWPTSIK
jgi:GR25 family glycosyltransferase involved in LPS biosynthesis